MDPLCFFCQGLKEPERTKVHFYAWIFLVMRESYLFLVKMVLSQPSLCTVTQKIYDCSRKINIPFPVKFMLQHGRIPKGPVPTAVNSKLPQSCCSRISSLTKSIQGKPPHFFLAVSSLAQVYCPGCLPSFQERNKHCPCSVPMGQSGLVLILSIIHLSLPLQVSTLTAELWFSVFFLHQCPSPHQLSQSCFQAMWEF